MKCCNPECVMDATRVPRRKLGPVKSFTDAAEQDLGVSHGEAVADDATRRRVVEKAKTLAYQEYPELGCCSDSECVAYAVTQMDDATNVQMVPARRRKPA